MEELCQNGLDLFLIPNYREKATHFSAGRTCNIGCMSACILNVSVIPTTNVLTSFLHISTQYSFPVQKNLKKGKS